MKERDYQLYAIDSIFNYWESGNIGNPLVVMPTGTGKSVVIAGAIRRIFNNWPGQRVLNLTHVKELVEQNYLKLLDMWPTAPSGVFSAGLGRKEFHYPITFAGIASAHGNHKLFGKIDMVFIDEAHAVSPDEDAMYNQFLNELKLINPHMVVVGLTATPFRAGQGKLTEGDNALFTAICCDMATREAFNWFIDQGYLCDLLAQSTEMKYEVDKLRTVAGDYDLQGMQREFDKDDINRRVVLEAIKKGGGRHHWLCFASGVKHTEHIAEIFNEFGVSATFVHSKMREKERDKRIADYKAGKYQVMVNNGILTTGFDFPAIDYIIMLRATKSVGLWIQMLGRGIRTYYADGFDLSTAEGRLEAIRMSQKPNCLVADFAGNTARLGPINDPVMPRKKGEKVGDAPVKICPSCGMYNNASATSCFNCGHDFPRQLAIQEQASTKPLISKEEKPIVERVKVDKVTYNTYFKENRPPSIQVTYYCGLNRYREYVCLEHQGSARGMAIKWWKERAQCETEEVPTMVANALYMLDNLRTPTYIHVWVNTKYPEVKNYEY